jgi:hypothetical protein
VDFVQLVVNMNVRPERPEHDQFSRISNSLWSLAEACWVKPPQHRPTASAVCDTIARLLSPDVFADAPRPPFPAAARPAAPTPMAILPDASTIASSRFAATSSTATVRSSSFTLSASETSSIAGGFLKIGGGGFDNLRIHATPPSESVRVSPFEMAESSLRPTTPGSSIRSVTTESFRYQVPASPILSVTEPMYSNAKADVSTGTIDGLKLVTLPAWPPAVSPEGASAKWGPRAPQDSPSDSSGEAQPKPRRSFDAAQPPTSDAYSIAESATDDPFGVAGPSTSNAPRVPEPPPRKDVRWTKPTMIKDTPTAYPWLPPIAPTAGTTLTGAGSGTGKRPRLPRITSLFRRRQQSAQTQSMSPAVREASGFRLALPGLPIPDSRGPPVEMWSLDDLMERWITRSAGGSVMVGFSVQPHLFGPDIIKDEEFQDVFLATYPAFTNCREVFNGLRLRFDAAETDDGPVQTRVFRRHRYIPLKMLSEMGWLIIIHRKASFLL